MHFALVFVGVIGVAASAACPSGWQSRGTKCYKLMTPPRTWTEQNNMCVIQLQGTLASINSAADNEIIRSIAGGQEIYTGGLSYARGPWSWSDHTQFGVYKNWVNGTEPAPTPARPCIKMNPSGKWFANCCRVTPAAAICVKQA